ncbi:lachesin-like, partial [Bombus impatiens]|uniref:Lachesin-like n=1 Tax=Bombus impatiens TaxID=132113 RepID=A0A6P8LDW1_BOMIM
MIKDFSKELPVESSSEELIWTYLGEIFLVIKKSSKSAILLVPVGQYVGSYELRLLVFMLFKRFLPLTMTGMLSVVVPPDFIPEETSSDVMVREGGQVKLMCRARGVPPPSISWRREDGKNIIIRKPFAGNALNQKSHVTSVNEYHGEELRLMKISRNEMGVYLCIAINGVPPAVSKRISINVHFSPVIHVPNQLVGAPLGTDVVLECFVEASPKSINYWVKDN